MKLRRGLPWKLIGLAGVAGVAATGVIIAREQRQRTQHQQHLERTPGTRDEKRYPDEIVDTFPLAAPERLRRLLVPRDAADGKDSIYRYDRAGLLIALKSTGTGR